MEYLTGIVKVHAREIRRVCAELPLDGCLQVWIIQREAAPIFGYLEQIQRLWKRNRSPLGQLAVRSPIEAHSQIQMNRNIYPRGYQGRQNRRLLDTTIGRHRRDPANVDSLKGVVG